MTTGIANDFHYFDFGFINYIRLSLILIIQILQKSLRYTVLCSTRLSYLAPKKKEDWPRCVKACWRKLPPVPVETGLSQQWTRPNKIPAGRYGYYRCIDQSHGMGPFISEHVKEKGGPRNFYRYFNNFIGNFHRSFD